jgi:hypothetical protein
MDLNWVWTMEEMIKKLLIYFCMSYHYHYLTNLPTPAVYGKSPCSSCSNRGCIQYILYYGNMTKKALGGKNMKKGKEEKEEKEKRR